MNTTKEGMLQTLNKSSNFKKSQTVFQSSLTPIGKENSGKKEQSAVAFKPVKLPNWDQILASTQIEEFSEEELAMYEKYDYDDILNQTEICKTIITEEDSQDESMVTSSIKCESTANSTVKSSADLQPTKTLNVEVSVLQYETNEKVVEEACFPLEEGSALLKDTQP